MAVVTKQNGTIGDDVLTISKKGYNYAIGLEGDDKYVISNIKKSWTIVDDALQNYKDMQGTFDDFNSVSPIDTNGGNDTVQINSVNANDLILFFDVAANGDTIVDESLCIVHKSYINSVIKQIKNYTNYDKLPTSGAVEIDYFNSENHIEHIQVLKGGVTKEIDVDSYRASVAEKVKNVLNSYGYSTAMEMIFNKKISKKQLNKLTACYKTPMDLIITGTFANDKIYAESGSDTIVFNADSGNDTVYNTTSADKLQFKDVEVSFLMKNGNNLYLHYGDNNKVTLYNYYKAKNKLDTYIDTNGSHKISEQTLVVTGKGKIYATAGDDIVEGSLKSDKIYGKGGNDDLYGDWGNDIIYSQSQTENTVLLAGEEGNDKLYAGKSSDTFYFGEAYDNGEGKDTIYSANSADKLRFVNIEFDDLKFTKSGNSLVITIADFNKLSNDAKAAYKNFKVTLYNYFKTGDKLDSIEFVDVNDSQNITTASIKDAKLYVSGSKKVYGTYFDDIITGSKKSDKITTGTGDDIVVAGKGNDTITLGAGNKTLRFNNGDGNDTVYANDADSVDIQLANCNSIDYIKGQGKSINNLYIERKFRDSKGRTKTETITLKNYFKYNNPNIKVTSDGITQDLSNVIYTIKGNAKKGGLLQGSANDEVLQGTDKVDVIWANGGNDVINAAKANDTIHAENTNCKINLNELDGVDTIYANSNSNIVLNYKGTEEEIRFFKSYDNTNSDLIITRGLDFKKDIVIIKGYYDNTYGDRPAISYQFNDGNIETVDKAFLQDLEGIYSSDSKNDIILVQDRNESIALLSKSILLTSPDDMNDTYIVNNARNFTFITDYNGEDTLQINNITQDKLKMFFNVNKENGLNVYNQTLYLFNSKDATLKNFTKCLASPILSAKKGIQIEEYLGQGKIENMMVADANGDNAQKIDAQTKIYVTAREVQKYLQELSNQGKNYESAAILLQYGNSKMKSKLLNLYLKTDVNKIMSNGYTFDYRHNLITNGSTLTGSDNNDKFLLNNSDVKHDYSNLTFKGGAGDDEYQVNTYLDSANNTGSAYNSSIAELNIIDTKGNDTYKIGANDASSDFAYGVSITDYEGDDNYELSTYLAYDGGSATAPKRTIIDDKAGNNTLSLVGNEPNVGVRFSVTLNDGGGYSVGDDLIIVNSKMEAYNEDFMNKNQGGCGICVKDYFKNNNMSIDLNGKTLNNDCLNQIAQEVASWLQDKGLNSTTEIDTSIQSDEFLAYFNQGNIWQNATSELMTNQYV